MIKPLYPVIVVSTGLLACTARAAGAAPLETAIVVDGDMRDWRGVLMSPANLVSDAPWNEGDGDAPVSGVVDLRAFAVTWKDGDLSFYHRRTVRGPANLKILVITYIDVGHDGWMDGADYLHAALYTNGGLWAQGLYRYVPAPPGGADRLLGDGRALPGHGVPASGGSSAMSEPAADQEFEAEVPWANLSVPAGSPLLLKAAAVQVTNPGSVSLNTIVSSLPQGIQDNTDVLDTGFAALYLSPGQTLPVDTQGGPAEFPHTVRNTGNLAQRINLSCRNLIAAPIEIHTDPNGDGNPADGRLLGRDNDGDGLFVSPGDRLEPGADTDGDLLPDTGLLARGEERHLVVRLVVPPSYPAGQDIPVHVSALSGLPQGPSRTVTDTARVGDVLVFPPVSLTAGPGSSARFAHRVCSLSPQSRTISLLPSSRQGWPASVLVNGSPATQITVPPFACRDVVLRVDVPAGATIGTFDAPVLLVRAQNNNKTDSVTDQLTIVAPLTLAPPGSSYGLPGLSVFYPHTLVNSTERTRTFALSAVSSQGTTASFWSDPDGDGNPLDGKLLTISPDLDPFGGSFSMVVQIDLPEWLIAGSTDVTRVTARDLVDGTVVTVDDATEVRRMATFAWDPPAPYLTRFPSCATVFAAAGGISPGTYRFRWKDPAGNLVRVSLPQDKGPSGLVRDSLGLVAGDPVGRWTIDLQILNNGVWLPVSPGGSIEFVVAGDFDPEGGRFPILRTDSPVYTLTGRTVSITSQVQNVSSLTFEGTRVEYVLFQDGDGSGTPGAGEPYMRLDGSRGSWTGGAFTCRSALLPRLGPGGSYTDTACALLGPMSFGSSGVWTLRARWLSGCGSRIASRIYLFNVGCTTGLIADAGPDKAACLGGSVTLGTPGQPGERFQWTPATGLDDPTIATPKAWPVIPTTYTLNVFDSSGCVADDDVTVVPADPPPVDAGASATICLGHDARLGVPAVAGHDYAWSPVQGLDNPASAQPLASPAVTTAYNLTVTDRLTGCTAADRAVVTVIPSPVADAGPGASSPAVIGPTVCDPALSYAWSPTTGLDNPVACNPVATTPGTMVYCLTVRHRASGCPSIPDCVTVGPPCAIARADAGPDQTSPARIGPPSCDPALEYSWTPATGLDNAAACNPLASPLRTTVYCLSLRDPSTNCWSDRDCATVSVSCNLGRPDAGPDGQAPLIIGPPSCDPALRYAWTPPDGLEDPSACRPLASPSMTTIYCLTLEDPVSGCTSGPDCVTVSAPPCAVAPGAVTGLLGARGGPDVYFEWSQEGAAAGGYRAYAALARADLALPASAGRLAFSTSPSVTATAGADPGAVEPAAGRTLYYRVVAVCRDGATEGP